MIAAINNLTATFGGGVATLSQGSGAVVISGGLAGFASGTLTLNVPGSRSRARSTCRSTRPPARVTDTFTVGGPPVSIDVPAAPLHHVAGTG